MIDQFDLASSGPEMMKVKVAEWQRLKRLECEYEGFRAAVAMMTGHDEQAKLQVEMRNLNMASEDKVTS